MRIVTLEKYSSNKNKHISECSWNEFTLAELTCLRLFFLPNFFKDCKGQRLYGEAQIFSKNMV